MPRTIPISEVVERIPSFVKIHPETYKGIRYKAKFTDLEFNEEFESTVYDVISLQHGCKSRSDKLRSTNSRRHGPAVKVPLEEVLEKLPKHLKMDESTYKGVNQKATFFDAEYNTTFDMIVANILRTGKGFCKQRHYDIVRASHLNEEEVRNLLKSKYGDKVEYLGGYKGGRHKCKFKIGDKEVNMVANNMLNGYYFDRPDNERWRAMVLVRDKFTCQKCNSTDSLECHHLLEKGSHPEQRLNANNGITLCWKCHNEYHAKYKYKETPENFFEFLSSPDLEKIIKQRLAEPPLEAPRVNLLAGTRRSPRC